MVIATIASAIGMNRGSRRIVTPLRTDGRRFTLLIDRRLFDRQAAGRFDCGPQDDRQTGGDATEHAAVSVGCRGDPRICPCCGCAGSGMKWSFWALPRIVTQPKPIPYSTPRTAGKLKSAWRDQPSTCRSRTAEPGGHAGGDDFCRPADRITVFADLFNQRDHLFGRHGIGATNDIRFAVWQVFDLIERDRCGSGSFPDVPDLCDVADNPTTEGFCENLLRDDARSHADGRFPAVLLRPPPRSWRKPYLASNE